MFIQLTYYFIYIYIYIYAKLKKNLIRFQIGILLEFNFKPYVPSIYNFKIFVPMELIQCENWILIRV